MTAKKIIEISEELDKEKRIEVKSVLLNNGFTKREAEIAISYPNLLKELSVDKLIRIKTLLRNKDITLPKYQIKRVYRAFYKNYNYSPENKTYTRWGNKSCLNSDVSITFGAKMFNKIIKKWI